MKVSGGICAELAGAGICSGEDGMLPEEQEENSRYFYELASAKFGFDESLLTRVQAFHFKGGQGAKTGTGGHLPGNKNRGKISTVRGIPEGHPAISPPTFKDLNTPEDFRRIILDTSHLESAMCPGSSGRVGARGASFSK